MKAVELRDTEGMLSKVTPGDGMQDERKTGGRDRLANRFRSPHSARQNTGRGARALESAAPPARRRPLVCRTGTKARAESSPTEWPHWSLARRLSVQ